MYHSTGRSVHTGGKAGSSPQSTKFDRWSQVIWLAPVKEGDGQSVTIVFKAGMSTRARTLLSSLPPRVVVVEDAGYSEDDLDRAAVVGFRELANDYDMSVVSAEPDLFTGSVNFTVPPGRASMAATLQRIQATIAKEGLIVRTGIRPGTVETQKHDNWGRGGGYVDGGGCTASFVLTNLARTAQAIGTAGHCMKTASHSYSLHSVNGGTTKSTSRIWYSTYGASGDIGIMTTGGFAPSNAFYYNFNAATRALSRSGMPAVGSAVCRFGVHSGYHCSTVRQANVKFGTASGGGGDHMVLLQNSTGVGGDSGGPHFFGTMAIGVYYGTYGGRDAFTPAYLYQNAGYDVYAG